jgi:polysaccharide biosynthesis protein PelG
MTILALAGAAYLTEGVVDPSHALAFRTVLIYTFCITLCLTGGPTMVASRMMADMIFARRMGEASSLIVALYAVSLGASLLVAAPLFFLIADLSPSAYVAAVVNFELVAAVWAGATFITALKDYWTITIAFAVGMIMAFVMALWLGGMYQTSGLLWGFNIGLGAIAFALLGRILAEYPSDVRNVQNLGKRLRPLWPYLVVGALHNLGGWSDKWIMWWTAPEAQSAINLPFYSHYDGAMFAAYLTKIPALAAFKLHVETGFFERYRRFYDDIADHATLPEITRAYKNLMETLFGGLRNLVVLQAAVTVTALLAVPTLVEMLDMDFRQVGMLRFGILGAAFHMLIVVATIRLCYFDLRYGNMHLQAVFLGTNVIGAIGSIAAGFPFYGYGYFLAAMVTALYGLWLVYRRVGKLPYITFVTNNPSLRSNADALI